MTDRIDLALMRGDLRGLTKPEIADLVRRMTDRMGIDPALAPIDVMPSRDGRLIVYVNARGTSELRKRHGLEITGIDVIKDRPGLVVLQARIRDQQGRTDTGFGAAAYREDRPGEEENAWLRAETKAKRRATLSIVGIFLEQGGEESDTDEETISVGGVGPSAGRAAAADPAPGPVAAAATEAVCGAPSPYVDEPEAACVLALGHKGYHRGSDKSSWGQPTTTPEYDGDEAA